MKIKCSKICVICGLLCDAFLCPRHRKRFIYSKKEEFIHFKPRRRASKLQSEIFKTIREVFDASCYQEVTFPWNMFYRYDIVIPEYKVIFEVDGRQHHTYVPFFHKSKAEFQRQKKNDVKKSKIAEDNGYRVFRINYNEKKVKDKIKWIKNKVS